MAGGTYSLGMGETQSTGWAELGQSGQDMMLRIGGDWTLAGYAALAARVEELRCQVNERTLLDVGALGASTDCPIREADMQQHRE